MLPKNPLGLIILSFLDKNKDGLTGYAIIKEIERELGSEVAPSPGSIYPTLKKLSEHEFISETNGIYKILPKGKTTLAEEIPPIIENSIRYMPALYKLLLDALPFAKRIGVIPNVFSYSSLCGCHPKSVSFNELQFKAEITDHRYTSETEERLNLLKNRLKSIKQQFEERLKDQIENIDKRIQIIDQELQKCNTERVKWRRIPIEDVEDAEKTP